MRIAVTGATGHLGANLVRLLVGEGYTVRALYHRSEGHAALDGLAVEQQPCDVLDVATLQDAFVDVEVVMNLAAVISIGGDPDGRVMQTNVEGPRNVVAACLRQKVRKLIHFSSIHAFRLGNPGDPIDETAPPADASSFRYDQSKALGEREVLAGVERGLDATILNPTGVIGPFDFAPSRAGRMLQRLFAGRMRLLVDAGFDWVDARDVARAAIAAIAEGKAGERYLLSGHWISFAELAALCGGVAGSPVRRMAVPVGVARLGLPVARLAAAPSRTEPLFTAESLAIVAHGCKACSHAKATRDLGFEPRPLRETLADTCAWFRSRGGL
jgi:nucleoside-diphosphate-sugar epimerase